MRNITSASYEHGQIVAVCDDGSLWIGMIRRLDEDDNLWRSSGRPSSSETSDLIVEWKPLNGPPDGEPWFQNKSRWDKIEEQIRANEQESQRR
jgi:hypothetical protein